MKSLKLLLLLAVLLSTSALVNQSFSGSKHTSYAYFRVRTVPGTSDQKKKEATHSTAPKPQPTSSSKTGSGFFCSETGNLKTKLAVTNGGAPK